MTHIASQSLSATALRARASTIQRQAEQAEQTARELKQEADKAASQANSSRQKAAAAQWAHTRAQTQANHLARHQQILQVAAPADRAPLTYSQGGKPLPESRPPRLHARA